MRLEERITLIENKYNELIDGLNKSYASKKNKDWISVKERLPFSGENVTVCSVYKKIVCAYIWKETEYYIWKCANSHNDINEEITHWKPLPAPPEIE